MELCHWISLWQGSFFERRKISLPPLCFHTIGFCTIYSDSMSARAKGTKRIWPHIWILSYINSPMESIFVFWSPSHTPLLASGPLLVAVQLPLDIWWPRSQKHMVFLSLFRRSLCHLLLLVVLTWSKCISSSRCRFQKKKKQLNSLITLLKLLIMNLLQSLQLHLLKPNWLPLSVILVKSKESSPRWGRCQRRHWSICKHLKWWENYIDMPASPSSPPDSE